MRFSPLTFILALMLPAYAFAGPSIAKKTLGNGLTVVVTPMPSSQSVSIYAYVKTGSAHEGRLLGTGVSHLVEHMLFKGTAKRPVGAIAKEVKALGGVINASTGFDYTMYTLDVPKGSLKQGMDIISDMLLHSAFDAAQMAKERDVIHGEMRLYNDKPERHLSDAVFQNAYVRHPYRLPIIGYPALFDTITHEQVLAYYRSRYVPNNMILSVAGAVSVEEVLAEAEAAFGDAKMMPFPPDPATPEPPQVSGRYAEEYYQTPLFRFSLAYQGVALNDPDLHAMDVLAAALGQGELSRLYLELYKKKALVKEVNASNFTPMDRGVFEVEGVMGADNLKAVTDAVDAVIENVKAKGLTAQELARVKRNISSHFIMDNLVSSAKAYQAAVDEGATGDRFFSQHYVDAVNAVTNEDIKRVARQYLKPSALSVTYLKPKASAPQAEEGQKAADAQDITKVVLDNGVRVLIKEDHTDPVVSVYAAFNGGLRQENAGNNGISNLLARMWVRGVGKRTEQQVFEEMARRGASMSGFSSRSAVGVQATMLSSDLPFMLDLLADAVTAPALSQAALDQERAKTLVAIDQAEDDIKRRTSKRLLRILFRESPYGLDEAGTKDSLAAISRADILAYYRSLAVAPNMVLSVFGDIDGKAVLEQVKRRFGKMPKGSFTLSAIGEPDITATRQEQVAMDKEQAMLMFGFKAPALEAKDRYAMECLDAILGSGLSGRLFVKVRDELGKAYTVGSRYSPHVGMGTMVLFVLTTKDKIDTVKDIVRRELAALPQEAVTDAELADAKAYLKGGFRRSIETVFGLGPMSAFYELYGMGYDRWRQYMPNIDAVSKEDIRRVAAQYLDMTKAAIVITAQGEGDNGQK